MGVSGSGKSTVGAELAGCLGLTFLDADDYHPETNVAKMSRGIPLTDEDRWPWLGSLGRAMRDESMNTGGVVATCSALKRAYRDHLREHIGVPMIFVLLDGDRETLYARMQGRKNHYMPPSLLDSQLADLERPDPDEPAVTVSIKKTVAQIVSDLEASLNMPAP
ncbi:MAG: gluconokinase [Gammaproteobacteria bacterium]|nr:gluconokinase [Gammaproteobacteria bacterium]